MGRADSAMNAEKGAFSSIHTTFRETFLRHGKFLEGRTGLSFCIIPKIPLDIVIMPVGCLKKDASWFFSSKLKALFVSQTFPVYERMTPKIS